MRREPVGSVHQPESGDSSRVRCRGKSREAIADTTCWLLPCVDFGAVCCCSATRRSTGFKNSATKDIPYSSSFQATHAHEGLVFEQQLYRFVPGAQSWAHLYCAGISRDPASICCCCHTNHESHQNTWLRPVYVRFLHRPWVNIFVSPVDFRYASNYFLRSS